MDYEEISYNNTFSREQQLASSLAFPILMRKVYVWMSLALVITGFTAYFVATSQTLLTMIFATYIHLFGMNVPIVLLGLIIAALWLVFTISGSINKLSLTTATLLFTLYSVLTGAIWSIIFLEYTPTSIVSVFFITSGTFGAMALYGYFTKKDLTSMGSILFMALIGVIIASLVNIFLKSSGLDLVVSCLGVLVFVGLTAYDSQKIKEMMLAAPDAGEGMQKVALLGALSLYLDFINLFIHLLRIFGRRD